MSLIDTNNLGIGKANLDAFERKDYAAGWNSALQAISEAAPTIDPETLPIVRQLREELARVTAERDSFKEMLYGERPCSLCEKYTKTWNPVCIKCDSSTKEYRPEFVLKTKAPKKED